MQAVIVMRSATRVSSRAAPRLLNLFCGALHHSAHMYSSSHCVKAPQPSPPAVGGASAVNVDTFTLNDDIVQRDLAYIQQWNELASRMDDARREGDHKKMVEEVMSGLQRLQEVGADNAPVLCEPLLCLEGAQAHVALLQYDDALCLVKRAESVLLQPKPEVRDMSMLGECRTLEGHILMLQGKGAEAEAVLQQVMNWIDVDAKSASPMQAVAAINLKRSVKTTLGRAFVVQAQQLGKERGGDGDTDVKKLYATALDTLIDGLDAHIDVKDSASVKSSLEGIFVCFEGLGDVSQALTTCKKYISWCSQQQDEEGVRFGKKMREEFCLRHQIDPNDSAVN